MNLFETFDPILYLTALGQGRRGFRASLAKTLGCQNSFVSNVFQGRHQFSLEHAEKIASFLGHSSEEKHYFLLMVSWSRAGTPELRSFLENQMADMASQIMKRRAREGFEKDLSASDQAIFAGSWEYGAIHVLCGLKMGLKVSTIAARLKLPLERTKKVVSFLMDRGILDKDFNVKTYSIWIRDLESRNQYHRNWRLKALENLSIRSEEDLHYSSITALTPADYKKLRALMDQFISELAPITSRKGNHKKKLAVVNLDCFEL